MGHSNDRETELRTLVLKLSNQVEKLTEVVSQLHDQGHEASAAV